MKAGRAQRGDAAKLPGSCSAALVLLDARKPPRTRLRRPVLGQFPPSGLSQPVRGMGQQAAIRQGRQRPANRRGLQPQVAFGRRPNQPADLRKSANQPPRQPASDEATPKAPPETRRQNLQNIPRRGQRRKRTLRLQMELESRISYDDAGGDDEEDGGDADDRRNGRGQRDGEPDDDFGGEPPPLPPPSPQLPPPSPTTDRLGGHDFLCLNSLGASPKTS